MTAADDLKAAFDIQHEAYRQGFLDGARAMQVAALAIFENWPELKLSEEIPMEIQSAHSAGQADAEVYALETIRALDPEKVGG